MQLMLPRGGQAEFVQVPMEQLKLIQDSLQRAEHAISGSLSAMVEQCTKLASERAIVINAINTVSTFTGQQPVLFG